MCHPTRPKPAAWVERIARAEEFFSHVPVTLKHGGNRAYYAQELDYVQIPIIEAFRDAESYYATLGHEFIHGTKHPTRVARDFGRKTWGLEGYAREELVAELGSAFLGADLELTPEVRDDHAGYIANWLEVLKNDKRCVVQAASTRRRPWIIFMACRPNRGLGLMRALRRLRVVNC